jgi:MtrB/PioB family decaheme-associated outer membrane protein
MKRMLVFSLALAVAVPALAADEGVKMDVIAGGQWVDTDALRDGYYYQYAFNPSDAILPLLNVERVRSDDPDLLRFHARWILRDDQSYWATLERSGKARLTLSYDQTPNWYSRNALALFNEGSGLHTIDESVRGALEGVAYGANPTTDVPPVLNEILKSTAHYSDLMARRDTYGLDGQVELKKNWRARVTLAREQRKGDKLISNGTYVRVAPNDSTFDRERFDIRGNDIIETMDYETWKGGVSTDYSGQKGFIRGGVDLSYFRNEFAALAWDNPFEASPGLRTIDGQSQANRGRFARGQLALPPDNDLVRGYASGVYRFGSRLRASATAAVSRITQDQTFLPFTINEAIFFPGPDGVLGTGDDVRGDDKSLLPQESLDGEIRTQRYDVRVSGKATNEVTVEAGARYYDYEDKTGRIDLPGYAAFSESAFRRGIGQTENNQNVLFSEPSDYTQTRYGLSGTWRFRPLYALTAAVERLRWDYDGRQVDKTDEDILTARLRGSSGPADWSAFYQAGRRDHTGDYEIGLEASMLRMFDVWDRDRDRFGAEVDVEVEPGLVVGVSGSRTADEYPGAPEGAPYAYGLQESHTNEVALSLNYVPDKARWLVSATGGYEDSEWKSLNVTKTAWDASSTYDPVNRWFRNQDDQTLWASAELRADLVPGRWTGRLGYLVTAFTGDVVTENPELTSRTINSAYAVEWSELKTTWQEVRVVIDRWISPGLGIGLRYAYTPFTIEDPAWNLLRPEMQGISQELRGSPTDFQDQNIARYLFLDSRYENTNAHAFAVVLSASL